MSATNPLLPVTDINAGSGQSLTDWYVYQFSQGVKNPSFYGAGAGAPQHALDVAALSEAQALYGQGYGYSQQGGYRNGVYVGSGPGSLTGDPIVAIAPTYQGSPIGQAIFGAGPSGSGLPSVGGIASGAATGVGPVAGGGAIPGGSAGSLNLNRASGVLSQLSHTTAGLNWSHLALWLAVLAGAYIALETLTGGKGRRR